MIKKIIGRTGGDKAQLGLTVKHITEKLDGLKPAKKETPTEGGSNIKKDDR